MLVREFAAVALSIVLLAALQQPTTLHVHSPHHALAHVESDHEVGAASHFHLPSVSLQGHYCAALHCTALQCIAAHYYSAVYYGPGFFIAMHGTQKQCNALHCNILNCCCERNINVIHQSALTFCVIQSTSPPCTAQQ